MSWLEFVPPMVLPSTGSFDAPDVIAALLLNGQAMGRYPHVANVSAAGVLPDDLSGFGELVMSTSHASSRRLLFVSGPDLLGVLVGDGRVHVTALSSTVDGAKDLGARAAGLVVPPAGPPSPDSLSMRFCFASGSGVRSQARTIVCPEWPAIAKNYSAVAADGFGRLVGSSRPSSGRLMLLWGEPGTGKTTALRALARAWRPWCDVSYVLDPEVLFGSAEYLHEFLLGPSRDGVDDVFSTRPEQFDESRWQLLIIEDADEIISADAKARTGQALSRLLNMTDGMLGQGLNTLVCITTNEDVTRLHPAVTRPGRCLAALEFPRLTAAEARGWLETRGASKEVCGGVPGDGLTLAECFSVLLGDGPIAAAPAAAHRGGVYL